MVETLKSSLKNKIFNSKKIPLGNQKVNGKIKRIMPETFTIYAVDDQDEFLNSLKPVLKIVAPELEVVGTYSDIGDDEGLEDLLDTLAMVKPDVVLMDVNFTEIERPENYGITLTKKITSKYPEQIVIMLAKHLDNDTFQRQHIRQSFQAGAKAFLRKASPERWHEGIKETINGDSFVDPEFLKIDKERLTKSANLGITLREIEVLTHLSNGLKTGEAAKLMGLGANGVNFHIKNVKLKLDETTAQGLVGKAFRLGLIV